MLQVKSVQKSEWEDQSLPHATRLPLGVKAACLLDMQKKQRLL